MQGLQRAWRCTLVVPYVHKPPVHMRRSAPALGADAKGRAMRQLGAARRDFGIFFMGAPVAPGYLAACVTVSACPFYFLVHVHGFHCSHAAGPRLCSATWCRAH